MRSRGLFDALTGLFRSGGMLPAGPGGSKKHKPDKRKAKARRRACNRMAAASRKRNRGKQ